MFENVGRALSLVRELRGLSQTEVARAAGAGKSQISKYERGRELPRLDSLARILAVLHIGYGPFFVIVRQLDDARSVLRQAEGEGSWDDAEITTLPEGGIVPEEVDRHFRGAFDAMFQAYREVTRFAMPKARPELTPRRARRSTRYAVGG
ncbi:MAG TPA: helix-turn-helix transcriptional regulator [Thermoanaerobaculia bacterium]|nr:helix-turn-helix transcriptional regulator [Thermoanaerobaculia bacterium]